MLSCSPEDNPGSDPDNGNDGMSLLVEEAARTLEQAGASGKTVSSVRPAADGFSVSFADGSSSLLRNGGINHAGATPFVMVDIAGYWSVSYDGGALYESVADAECSGGTNGVGLRVAVEGGSYAYQLFAPSSPQTTLRTIRTSVSPNPSSVLQSIVRDDNSGIVTLTLADEKVFEFPFVSVPPSAIELLREEVILPSGGPASFDIRIVPADARFAPVAGGEGANLSLTGSDNVELTGAERSVTADGKVIAGRVTVTARDLGKAAAYRDEASVVLTTHGSSGETVRLTSASLPFAVTAEPCLLSVKIGSATAVQTAETVFHIKLPYGTNVRALRPEFATNGGQVELNGSKNFSTVDFSNPVNVDIVAASGARKTYTVVVHYSDLPILYIKTPSRIDSKEEWIKSCTIGLWNAGKDNAVFEEVQMKGRGNSTWTYEKKPYAVKLDKKAEVLGMPKHKRWVLLANFLDHTCMRNAVAFDVARRFPGLGWTPRGRFVEVVMNGVLQGNYYLCEQIKIDENRVNIAEIEPTDVSGDALTGGYLVELDVNYDEAYKFKTDLYQLPVQFKGPDEDIPDAQFEYVRGYFNSIESSLAGFIKADVFDYIDLDSFVDWFLVNNVVLNYESLHPKSCYMFKDRGGKLKAGPVWDFDYGTFVPVEEGLIGQSSIWYDMLLTRQAFVSRLRERWKTFRPELENVVSFIDETAVEIRESAEANRLQWPNESFDFINGDTRLTFGEAVERMKQAYRQRIATLDKLLQ